MFSLSRYWQTVFQNCCSNLSSHDNHESSSCSTHLPNLWIFRDLKKKFIHSSVSLVILCFCFNLHFLTNYAQQLLYICWPFRSSYHFLLGYLSFSLLLIGVTYSGLMQEYLVRYKYCKYFLPLVHSFSTHSRI